MTACSAAASYLFRRIPERSACHTAGRKELINIRSILNIFYLTKSRRMLRRPFATLRKIMGLFSKSANTSSPEFQALVTRWDGYLKAGSTLLRSVKNRARLTALLTACNMIML
jgi:hypothetical protein